MPFSPEWRCGKKNAQNGWDVMGVVDARPKHVFFFASKIAHLPKKGIKRWGNRGQELTIIGFDASQIKA